MKNIIVTIICFILIGLILIGGVIGLLMELNYKSYKKGFCDGYAKSEFYLASGAIIKDYDTFCTIQLTEYHKSQILYEFN